MKKIFLLLVVFGILAMFGLALPQSGLTAGGTYYFSDSFESGLGNWTVSGNDWARTDTDYRTGSHCATDSPGGYYAANANAIMTLTTSIDLSGSTTPWLSFWHNHWIDNRDDYGHYGIDYGYVDVSQDGGLNWTNIAIFTGNVAAWTQVRIDLTPYKSDQVLLRFRLVSNGDIDNWDGWYVDDVVISEKDPLRTVFPFSDNFESGLGNWAVSSRDWAIIDTNSRSGNHSVTDSPVGYYPPYTNAIMELAHPINLSGTTTPRLSFWHKYWIDNRDDYGHYGIDYGYVDVSQDGGLTWANIATFTGSVANWTQTQVDLTPYNSGNILIRFRLVANGDVDNWDGWYMDDVEIKDASVTPVLYAGFTVHGLYKYKGTAWNKINKLVPTSMAVSGANLYANFTGLGLYKYNGNAWSKINTSIPTSMAASYSDLYAGFTGLGIYKYNGTAWGGKIHKLVPTIMAASYMDLYAGFSGDGLYKYDGTAWSSKIHTLVPNLMAATGTELYAYFTGSGIYKYNGTTWNRITTSVPAIMTASGTELYISITGAGIFRYTGTAWSKIASSDPVLMAASNTNLFASFTGLGIYKYNGTSWARVNTLLPVDMKGNR